MERPAHPVPVAPWRVSLHGGHSGQFCGHAAGTLEEVLEAAVAAGFSAYGVSEHAPRSDERFLYQEERDRGWDVGRLQADFEAYAEESRRLVDRFAGRLTVLRGFEAEVVPEASWAAEMAEHRRRHGFDYVVGSVHHVDGWAIDGRPEELGAAVERRGSMEAVAVAYYAAVAAMVDALRPEVVGHIDLIRKLAAPFGSVDTAAARRAALGALEAVAAAGAVLEVNTAGLRTGLGHPYPAAWMVREAVGRGIGFCFGDDSHGPEQVGAGVEEARGYLLGLRVGAVRVLERVEGSVRWREIGLR